MVVLQEVVTPHMLCRIILFIYLFSKSATNDSVIIGCGRPLIMSFFQSPSVVLAWRRCTDL